MNVTHLMAALLPSYIMFITLVIADLICMIRDHLDTPVYTVYAVDIEDTATQQVSRRGNVHAEMRAMRLLSDGDDTQVNDLHDGR